MQGPWLPEEDQARIGMYSLLSRLLAAPADQAQLDELAQMELDANAQGVAAVALSMLRLAAQRAQARDVDNEYHTLFIGVGRGELVPFGSWYQTGAMMERPLGELRQDLARFGLEREAGNPDPEDHVAFLCATMAFLASSQDFDDATERNFFRRHVGNWMSAFFHDLENAGSACFYKAVGHLGAVFMDLEKAYHRFDER